MPQPNDLSPSDPPRDKDSEVAASHVEGDLRASARSHQTSSSATQGAREEPAGKDGGRIARAIDLASKLLVPAAALIVSIAAVVVAIETKDISKRQALIAARQLQPVITASLSYGIVSSEARDQFLTISNVGGPASNVDADVATLLEVEYLRPGGVPRNHRRGS